jgi:hypothetical protein
MPELLVMVIVGAAKLDLVTTTELVAVHPFVPDTVTVNVAGVDTNNSALVPTTAVPLDHE